MLRRWFTLLLISMLPILTMAQSGTVYPIDLSVMMTPPYGPCLKEYVGSNRINIQALLKDFTKTSDQFVVELKVTDNRNRVVLLTHFGDYQFAAGRTFTYPMGPNADQGDKNNVLHQLFENAKIQPKNECFEEGSYIFTFQAFDAHSYHTRKIALSMPFSYPVFLQGNSVAPLQIYPYENEVLCPHSYEYTAKNGVKRYATQLGGIAYQWQSANPTGMRVGYLLQVVSLGQIGDRTKNNIESEANSMFDRVDRANYTVNVLSYSPFYNHPFTMGNYEEGNAYAWRVFALTGDELNEGENANVKGKDAPARVFYFCGAPGIEKDDYEVIKDDREFDKNLHKVKMDTVKSTDLNALALWRDSSVKNAYCGVNVEIRKKGQEKWTPYFVEQTNKYDESIDPTDNSYNFTNLSYNTRYEVRAQYVKCENCAQRPTDCVYAPYSDILEFVIAQPIDSATCGKNLPKLADCGDGVKAPRILAGDTIIANGTKVVVDSVSYPNASDSSIISGKGHICMPIVKNIQLKMEFDEITINCAKELVKGKIVSVWDDKTCAMIDIDELGGQNSTGGKDNAASDATVEEYDPSTANDKPAGTLMVDKDGTVKFKTKDGKIEDIGKSITLSAQEYQSKGFLSDNAHYIEFYNEDKNNAFDNNAQGYYDKISKYEYFDSPLNKVVLPWLANNPGKIKKIKAREVKKKETIASFESVMFVIPSGDSYIQLDAKQDKDGNYELQIPGWADVDYSTPIYAIARNSAESSYFDAGKMMQANYAERTHKLNIVSLIGDLDASYKTAAEKALNSIYGRVGVTWEVELTKFDNDSIKNEILKDGLSIAADDESCWKKETREMKAIRKLYQNSVQTIDKDAAYLFVVNHPEEDKFKGTQGDMPRSQSVGYIFKDNVTDASKFGRLVSHEIGHGVYKLQHTFDYDIPEKTTDNLMDYNGGDFLAHYQWRVMQDSVMFVWGLFQDDEDGMGIIDGFYWIGRNTISLLTDSKFIFNTEEQKQVVDHKKLFEEISECVGNNNPYITERTGKEKSWTPYKEEEVKTLVKNIINSKECNLKYWKSGNYYYCDISEDYFEGRVFAFVFKDAPVLSDYKVENIEQLLENKRSKAVYYREKYSMIPFYSETKELILALQFVYYGDRYRVVNYGRTEMVVPDVEAATTKIAEKLLVDPTSSVLPKCDAAILSAHVYGKDDKDYDVWYEPALKSTDWEVDTKYLSEVEKNHLDCGFKSQLYKKRDANIYCYVTAGTEGLFDPDALTDLGQVLGYYLHQYIHSVVNAKILKEKIEKNGGQLFFAGHSLGGGLATCNSLATGCPAKTFNPAAVSIVTYELFTYFPGFLHNHTYDSQIQEKLFSILKDFNGLSKQQVQEKIMSVIDDIRKSNDLNEMDLSFVSDGNNIINYVISGEVLDRVNYFTYSTIKTKNFGSYVYIDWEKDKWNWEKHSINNFLNFPECFPKDKTKTK